MLHGSLVRPLVNVAKNAMVTQKRTIVQTAPLVRMNVYKKMIIGGLACSSYVVIPSYIIYNMKYYNKSAYKTAEDEEEE